MRFSSSTSELFNRDQLQPNSQPWQCPREKSSYTTTLGISDTFFRKWYKKIRTLPKSQKSGIILPTHSMHFNAIQFYKYLWSPYFCQTLRRRRYTIVSKWDTVPAFAISFLSRVVEGTSLSFPGKCMLLVVTTLEKPTPQKLESMTFHKHSPHGLCGRIIPSRTFLQLHSCVR